MENNTQKAKLVELMVNYFMKDRGHLRESDALEFAEDAYIALLSAGALVQDGRPTLNDFIIFSTPECGTVYVRASAIVMVQSATYSVPYTLEGAAHRFPSGHTKHPGALLYFNNQGLRDAKPLLVKSTPEEVLELISAAQDFQASLYTPTAPRTEPGAGELVGALRNSNIELAAAREHVSSLIGREMIDLRMDANAKKLAAYEAATKTEGGV